MKNNFLTVILIILVLGMGGYLVYDKMSVKDTNNSKNEEKDSSTTKDDAKKDTKEAYTYKNIAGKYSFVKEPEGENWPQNYYLLLGEDGMFTYMNCVSSCGAYTGNYIIEDNKIILNYLGMFNNSIPSFSTTDGTYTLTITEGGSILDEKNIFGYDTPKNITLSKVDSFVAFDGKTSQDSMVKTAKEVLKQDIEAYINQ